MSNKAYASNKTSLSAALKEHRAILILAAVIWSGVIYLAVQAIDGKI
jgi:hypothetical protein